MSRKNRPNRPAQPKSDLIKAIHISDKEAEWFDKKLEIARRANQECLDFLHFLYLNHGVSKDWRFDEVNHVFVPPLPKGPEPPSKLEVKELKEKEEGKLELGAEKVKKELELAKPQPPKQENNPQVVNKNSGEVKVNPT